MKKIFSIFTILLCVLALPAFAEDPTMPSFGETSQTRLDTCSTDIQAVCNKLITRVDFSVLEGARETERQIQLFAEGRSKLDGIIKISKHQVGPDIRSESDAVDLLPYPIIVNGTNIWTDQFRFTLFAGELIATAWDLGVEMRWGGDWDGDGSKHDQTFHDLPHFESIA